MLSEVDNFMKSRLEMLKFDGRTLKVYDYEPERDQKETEMPNASLYRVDYVMRNKDIRADHEYFIDYSAIIKDVNTKIPMLVEVRRIPSVMQENSIVRISGIVGTTAANGIWMVKNISQEDKTFELFNADGTIDGMYTLDGLNPYVSGGYVETLIDEGDGIYGPSTFTRKPFPSPVNVYYEVTVSSSKKSHADSLNELINQVFPPGFQSTVSGCMGMATFILLQHYIRDEREKPLYRSSYQYVVDGLWMERLERYAQAPMTSIDWQPTVDNIDTY